MADKQSPEKQALLRAYAPSVIYPTDVEPESPESTTRWRDGSSGTPGAFSPGRSWNEEIPPPTSGLPARRSDQTAGRITHLVASAGTGGTVSGTGHFLKARNPAITVIGADPEGSVLSGDAAAAT